ncbi:hypothetical protein [Pseudacidovorax sp. RU35E]|uniref:hypothetical protein n=1 Tax=Pseudacidovorax sp. RU35E TaxID=1907403 RepID=UPI000954718D|nr:hypothetical protein [Pseudacidovorax sp. RU35E]SIQ00700.1 hypothetical protein SAMN05880557_101491 [Pseudacidovorax sp. RU35E]
MSTDTPQHDSNAPTVEDRLDALEFVVGQLALSVEVECAALRAHQGAPATRSADATDEDGDAEPFTVDGLRKWLEFCVQRMEAHGSASKTLQLAIQQSTRSVCSFDLPRDRGAAPLGRGPAI